MASIIARLRKGLGFLVVTGLVCAAPSELQGQSMNGPSRARLLGIYDSATGEPLEGVQVFDLMTRSSVTTDRSGTVHLGFLQTQHDSGVIWVRKLGYRDSSFIVLLGRRDTSGIMLLLERVVLLAPMTAIGSWRLDTDDGKWEGFERRCSAPHVGCLTASDLARYPAANLSDMLTHTEAVGVKRTCPGSMARCELSVRQCSPWFWIDGVPYAEHLWEVEQWYGTQQFKGVEVYGPENTPLRYRHPKKRCAVVLWTK